MPDPLSLERRLIAMVISARGDRLDAATALPSQFAQRHGDPEIMHDDHTHNRAGRHGSKVNEDLLKYGGGHQ